MAFVKLCNVEDLWEGEMESFEVNGREILVVWPSGGEIVAFQAVCPHQDIPLVEGKFDGKTIICRAHQWMFDCRTGAGVNPSDCRLAKYPIKIEGDDVLVETEGVQSLFAHT
ncbi:Rieske 2Fe-2S domain-containing protein [Nevskia soli]|uniref:Rieske 2Fe-2S domain-containing protein n=1 Tax=Nevskia soli TaxID=418856 RepID=UPI0004A77B8F|nr:Rieske 2Fe-2S domain-containing protein [Nevskia soli]